MSIRRVVARVALAGALLLGVAGLGLAATPAAHAATCLPATMENGEDEALTALIVVSGTTPVTISGAHDAAGCDIGVYIAPGARATISYADIYSAKAFGIYNDGGQVTITHTQVHGILGNGESCGDEDEESCGGGGGGSGESRSYTGGRHGTGILFVGAGARGTITSSVVSDYGRRGISVSGPGASAQITGNQVIAPSSPASWLNGVWIANGARANIVGNHISGNVTPDPMGKSSSAIMIAGGASHNGMPYYTNNIQISGNTLTNNDTGVLLSNVGLSGTTKVAPATPTRNYVAGNTVKPSNPVASNDAGIKDAGGNRDNITGNVITGYGDKAIVITPLSVNTLVAGNTIN